MVAGGPNAGKTTLLASIYDRFLRGPFGRFRFAGSETLLGFDERAFPGHTESRLQEARTEHTYVGAEDVLLHLRIKSSDDLVVHDLLLADLSGEKFRLARDDVAEVRSSTLLSRADHITLLVDGSRLSKLGTRDSEIANGRMLVRSLVAGGAVNQETGLQLAISKWDVVASIPNGDELAAQATASARQAAAGASHYLSDFRIAARPEQPKAGLDWGHGVDELLDAWTRLPKTAALQPTLAKHVEGRAFRTLGDE